MSKPKFQYPWRSAVWQLENGLFQAVTENIETREVVRHGKPGTKEEAIEVITAGKVGISNQKVRDFDRGR